MAEGAEKIIVPIQTYVPVEQSMSIDPNLEREKQQDSRRPKKNRPVPTVQEQLDQEQLRRANENPNSEHVDYHA